MSYARQMLDTFASSFPADAGLLASTIDALVDCAQACTADADANLSESDLADMVRCIRLCLNCADVCTAAVRVTSRVAQYQPDVVVPLLQACLASCQSCGDECERHAPMHEHCRICGEACRRCERACQDLLDVLR
jgi:hypothetical protein